MLTDIQLINLGLSKIASSRVQQIKPPRTPLEAFMAANYPHWKRTELTKRRWVFSTEEQFPLTLTATLTGVARPYKYGLPPNCLRPIRTKRNEWIQRGRFIFSAYNTLAVNYIRDCDEREFDPLFDEVLGSKIGLESCEYVTQSNTKKDRAQQYYDDAVSAAGQANAFIIGPEDIDEDDEEFSWVSARYT